MYLAIKEINKVNKQLENPSYLEYIKREYKENVSCKFMNYEAYCT